MIFAVVPAAGHSARMGRPKLALPVGDRTVLECVVGALRKGGAEVVVVVIGPHVPELVPLAESAGAAVLSLVAPTTDMRATVEHGLRWLEDHHHPRAEDAFLLAPGDHPELDAALVRDLCDAYHRDPERSIWIPARGGTRGHPALIGWQHVAGLRTLPANQGINAYFRAHSDQVRELAVDRGDLARDLDTPEDYDRLLGRGRTDP